MVNKKQFITIKNKDEHKEFKTREFKDKVWQKIIDKQKNSDFYKKQAEAIFSRAKAKIEEARANGQEIDNEAEAKILEAHRPSKIFWMLKNQDKKGHEDYQPTQKEIDEEQAKFEKNREIREKYEEAEQKYLDYKATKEAEGYNRAIYLDNGRVYYDEEADKAEAKLREKWGKEEEAEATDPLRECWERAQVYGYTDRAEWEKKRAEARGEGRKISLSDIDRAKEKITHNLTNSKTNPNNYEFYVNIINDWDTNENKATNQK